MTPPPRGTLHLGTYSFSRSREPLSNFARFNSVEVHETFVNSLNEAAFRDWRARSPAGFTIALRAPRAFTHVHPLSRSISGFVSAACELGDKLGPIVFRFPPGFEFDPDKLDEFTSGLPPSSRYVFEFRHESWQCDTTYEILESRNIANCAFDVGGRQNEARLTSDFGYVRVSGAVDAPPWASRLRKWLDSSRDVYLYAASDAVAESIRGLI